MGQSKPINQPFKTKDVQERKDLECINDARIIHGQTPLSLDQYRHWAQGSLSDQELNKTACDLGLGISMTTALDKRPEE